MHARFGAIVREGVTMAKTISNKSRKALESRGIRSDKVARKSRIDRKRQEKSNAGCNR